jgi:radical SAM superfamily enzyme YgiQ (UPF0313 family)
MNLRAPGAILLVSCYELGHQPLGVALPLGFLEKARFAPAALDIAVEKFDANRIASADFIAISVPMHTALRLGIRVASRIGEINPNAVVCFYGLYAALNADYLLEHGGDYCIGGEIEAPLVRLVEALDCRLQIADCRFDMADGKANGNLKSAICNLQSIEGVIQRGMPARPHLQRLSFAVPARTSLPTLDQYARLEHNGASRVTGYVEASRGCLHLCTHCPIPPVYDGRFFVIPEHIVLEDIRRQVQAGARHITFGDPDFLNGPGHSLSVVRAMHAEFPELTFDITTKVEHILKRGTVLPELGRLGCLFAISAVESVSDEVLQILEKNHNRADIAEAVQRLRAAGIAPRPTWVAFTPWTSLGDYLDMLAFIEEHDLIDNVDPVQYTIRLLVPPGSYILNRPEMKPHLGPLDQASFSYRWTHPDPRMDRLHKTVSALVEKDVANGVDPAETFYRVWSAASGRKTGAVAPTLPPNRWRAPRLSEPWFC